MKVRAYVRLWGTIDYDTDKAVQDVTDAWVDDIDLADGDPSFVDPDTNAEVKLTEKQRDAIIERIGDAVRGTGIDL